MTTSANETQSRWSDALLAAAMIALDPDGLGGIHLRARAGPVRDVWLERATSLWRTEAPLRRISAGIPETRLTGGLDIGLTLETGRLVSERGVLASANGGLIVIAMAERLETSAAAMIGMALDDRFVRVERDGISTRQAARFALIALDEGIDDEALAAPLAERMGLHVYLDGLSVREVAGPAFAPDIAAASALLPTVVIADEFVEALCAVALSAGVGSMRASLHLVRAARAAAALRQSNTVEVEDASTALRLVLGMQASSPEQAPPAQEDNSEQQPPESSAPETPDDKQEPMSADALRDMLVEAVDAVLPKHLLASLGVGDAKSPPRGEAGKSGAWRNRARRGRVIGTSDKPPVPGARLDVLATLRQAAPWQRIRARGLGTLDPQQQGGRLHIRKSDFRYRRYREKNGTTAIFAVDASGSAAIERLAETKGAIELLLAECYVRRDHVALIAFRGREAETLLEPTRSLVRAKRSLSALPGGGGTPLASGVLAALTMATKAAGKGQGTVAVFLTDGRGNVGLDGGTQKAQVAADTQKAVTIFRAAGIRSIVIDTAQRPHQRAELLARDLGAEYLALPRGGAQAMAREIGSRMAVER